MFKILLRLFIATILFASTYIIYTNTTYNSFENLKSKNNISVNFQNLPEMILPSRESSTGYQYELMKKYLKTIGQKNLITQNITYDIDVYYTSSVCKSCIVINEEDLLIISNVSGNEGKDIEVIQPFRKINLEYDILDTYEINYSINSIDELIYNIDNNQLNNIYEFMNYDKNVLKINKINSSTFGVIVSEDNSHGLKVISRSIYDLNGNSRDKIRIENKDFSVIETRFLENKYAISILSNKRSKESVGVQYNKLDNNMAVSQKVHLFENLDSITTLTNYKKTKRSKFRIGELFYIDSLSIYDNKILLTIESLKSDDNNDGFSNYQYIPFYNTYSGTYDRKINPRFGGYLHNYFMILSFDYDGEIVKTHAKKIDQLQTFEKKIYIEYIFGNDYHLSSYVNKGKIFISKHFNKIAAEDKEYTYDIETFDNETTIKTETNPEGTYHLGNKIFITYGIQNVKKINNDRKRVLFINKIEIID